METFSALLAICAGNSPVTGEFPAKRPVARSFDIFFDLRLNKRWSKRSWGRWFQMPSRPLWSQCNIWRMTCKIYYERCHDDVIKWKYFPRYWLFVWGIHRSPVNSPRKGQWRWALMCSLICAWVNGWVTIVRLVIWDAIALIMTSM